eukprot:3124635-Prymnesium_polylepis.1
MPLKDSKKALTGGAFDDVLRAGRWYSCPRSTQRAGVVTRAANLRIESSDGFDTSNLETPRGKSS